MKRVLTYVMSLVVGVALVPLAGCSKTKPSAKPEEPGPAAKSEEPGPAARPDPLAAAAKRLVGTWEGKPSMPPGPQKGAKKGPPMDMDMTMTVQFKDGGAMTTVAGPFPMPMNGTWEVVKAEGNNVTVKSVMEMPHISGKFSSNGGKEEDKVEVKTKNQTEEFSIVFQTDDRITMAPTKEPEEALTLDRQEIRRRRTVKVERIPTRP